MEKQNLLKAVICLVIGALVGYFIANITMLSIYELKTPATSVNADFNKDLVSFSGAWILVSGSEEINDINSVAVHCWKDKNICNVAEANVLFNDMFTNNISYYEISEWSDGGQITAISSALCETKTLKADVKSKTVTVSEARNSSVDAVVCPHKGEPSVLNLGAKGF